MGPCPACGHSEGYIPKPADRLRRYLGKMPGRRRCCWTDPPDRTGLGMYDTCECTDPHHLLRGLNVRPRST